MTNLPFIVAAYGGILGALATYSVVLLLRLAAARRRDGAGEEEAHRPGADSPE